MKYRNLINVLFLLSTILACQKENDLQMNANEPLIGFWANGEYNETDNTYTFSRVSDFLKNGYGFQFDYEKKFIERKNTGWCGTPPVSYDNFEGTWSTDPHNVFIEVPFWGGNAKYTWEVISVNLEKLVIKKTKEDYQTMYLP